jgi:hypothetical protein
MNDLTVVEPKPGGDVERTEFAAVFKGFKRCSVGSVIPHTLVNWMLGHFLAIPLKIHRLNVAPSELVLRRLQHEITSSKLSAVLLGLDMSESSKVCYMSDKFATFGASIQFTVLIKLVRPEKTLFHQVFYQKENVISLFLFLLLTLFLYFHKMKHKA